ncbi:MAG: M24 family metallopeptidase, partial [Nitrospirae bacterium]
EKRRVYRTVHEALKRAKKAIKQGVKAYMVDAAARDHIRADGYGRQFGHGTGHGVGLDIHEAPRISWIGKETLRKGMVFTVEPGVYIPGMGGVRIEDMVTITGSGVKTLTSLSRRLEIIK